MMQRAYCACEVRDALPPSLLACRDAGYRQRAGGRKPVMRTARRRAVHTRRRGHRRNVNSARELAYRTGRVAAPPQHVVHVTARTSRRGPGIGHAHTGESAPAVMTPPGHAMIPPPLHMPPLHLVSSPSLPVLCHCTAVGVSYDSLCLRTSHPPARLSAAAAPSAADPLLTAALTRLFRYCRSPLRHHTLRLIRSRHTYVHS